MKNLCPYCGVKMYGTQSQVPSGRPRGMPRKQWKADAQRSGLFVTNNQAPTRDHTVPQSRGGRDWILCCYACNQEKGHLTINEWRAALSIRYKTICVFWWERQMLRHWLTVEIPARVMRFVIFCGV